MAGFNNSSPQGAVWKCKNLFAMIFANFASSFIYIDHEQLEGFCWREKVILKMLFLSNLEHFFFYQYQSIVDIAK